IPGVSRVAMRPKLQVTPVCPSAGIGSEWAQRGGNGVATMSLSYEEAYAQVTGPGQIFELVEDAIDGVSYRVFKNAPPTLGQLFAGARERRAPSSSTRTSGGPSKRPCAVSMH